MPRRRPIVTETGELAYGPFAVARHDGRVIFVRGGAPGERVEAELYEEHQRYAFARVTSVITPSPQRRTPPCPYLPRCGGCPWQHVAYAAQLDAKRRILREHLRRIAGLAVEVEPVLASPSEFAYRSRLRLRVAGGEVGFYAGGSHDLVPVQRCLLASEEINRAIGAARDLVRRLHAAARRVEIAAAATAPGKVVLDVECEGRRQAGDDTLCERWLAAHPGVGGIRMHGRRWQCRWGDTAIVAGEAGGRPLLTEAGGFTQANPQANRLLVGTALALAGPLAGTRIADLFAGAGNFALPLAAAGARVVAVEADPQSCRALAANAARLGLRVEALQGRAEDVLRQWARAGRQLDALILDPPRGGAADCAEPLLELRPARIVYVSCNPATLARDLGRLTPHYRIAAVRPVDLFPQTYHVETVVRLERAAGGTA